MGDCSVDLVCLSDKKIPTMHVLVGIALECCLKGVRIAEWEIVTFADDFALAVLTGVSTSSYGWLLSIHRIYHVILELVQTLFCVCRCH